jgi:mRNA-degrading endonuclease toxin of MazEF toxin-antitoxin module
MKRGEIWFVDLEPTVGPRLVNDQRGKRPVLVVSTEAFYRASGVSLICPITSGGNLARDQGFAVPLSGTGLKTTGVVIASHARTVDLKGRKARRIETAPDFIVDDVLARLAAILE